MRAEGSRRPVSVTTRSGEVVGRTSNGVNRFLGVPYAAPPFGPNRFRPAQPHDRWDRAHDATVMGPTAPQSLYDPRLEQLIPTRIIPGDEILNLNIWAPSTAPPGGAPVLLWIHGGSLTHGSNALEMYDGTRFARSGVVFVAINYRLGIEGFSVLDDALTNLGLMDQAAALTWIVEEISSFGGDPTQITVMGQSAGGAAVAALVSSPETRGLMRRAIIQSGPLVAMPTESVRETTDLIAHKIGIMPTREAFSRISPNALLAAQTRVVGDESPMTGGPSFQIALDGRMVPEIPWEAVRGGVADGIDLLIGVTTDERRLWISPGDPLVTMNKRQLGEASTALGLSPELITAYQVSFPESQPGEILGGVLADLSLRGPMIDLAEARARRGSLTYVYEFAWPSPVMELGAAHSVDLPFVFHTLDQGRTLVGDSAPSHLATVMNDEWVEFAKVGSVSWSSWQQARSIKTFDGGTNSVVDDPQPDRYRELAVATERRRRTLTSAS